MIRGLFWTQALPVLVLVTLFSCNNNADKPKTTDTVSTTNDTVKSTHHAESMMPQQHAEAVLTAVHNDTTVTGAARFDVDSSSGKVIMKLDLNIPAKSSKSVAVHIHEHGDCGDTAKAAHAHWNPTNAKHGKWGSTDFHVGDIGNVKLDSKGIGSITITTDLWALGGGASKNILGKSIIIHGGIDDFKSQPSGNSGSRIGCGVIK